MSLYFLFKLQIKSEVWFVWFGGGFLKQNPNKVAIS